MSYMVLARKWRPRNFAETVGQEHVLKALINALDHDRLHHAFLFTGTRGVGKTTIARILARSLNCEQGVSSKPCGECASCREIDEGRFVDLIEVDAASRTGVDDTRELMENVQYAPTRGRYKVYIIDEVHMLSKSAFNALLKTLEEPPPHVKFLLATTDPQKIPVTVLSRCLQFNLKRLSLSMIQGRLEHILEAEDIAAEKDAVTLLARAADGSLRDGLSLLDQAIAFGGGRVEEAGVREMLGTIQRESVLELLDLIGGGDASAVLDAVTRLDERAPDYADLLQELASLLQRVALAQVVAEPEDDDRGDREAVAELATRLDAEDVQLFYQIAIAGRRDLPLAPDPRAGFEMTLLRMLGFRPSAAPAATGGGKRPEPAAAPPAPRSDAREGASAADPPAAPVSATPAPSSQPQASEPEPPSSQVPPAEGGSTHPWAPPEDWSALVDALGLTGVAGQLAAHCLYRSRDGNRIRLLLDQGQAHLETDLARQRLAEALSRHFGEELRIGIELGEPGEDTPAMKARRRADDRQKAAQDSIMSDPNIRALEEQFDASVRPEDVRPEDWKGPA